MGSADATDVDTSASPPRRFIPSYSDFFSLRARKQLSIYLAGAGFFAVSTLVTRRAMARRYKETIPAFYHFNTRKPSAVGGAREAFEALNLATINVFSLALMVSGGFLWAFDISGLDELRTRIRAGIGVQGSEKDANEEIEEWIATVLARKDDKEREQDRRREKLKEAFSRQTGREGCGDG